MAQGAQTWVNPNVGDFMQLGETGDLINRTLDDLTTWLYNPTFQNGLSIGNGTPPTYDPVTNTQTAPAPGVYINGDTLLCGTGSFNVEITNNNQINFIQFGSTVAELAWVGSPSFTFTITAGIYTVSLGQTNFKISGTSGSGGLAVGTVLGHGSSATLSGGTGTNDGFVVCSDTGVTINGDGAVTAAISLNNATINLTPGSGGLVEVGGNPILATLQGATQPVVQVGNTSVTFTAGAGSITFPHAFPTACDAWVGVLDGVGGMVYLSANPGASSVSIDANGTTGTALTGAHNVVWIAIGH